MINKFLILFMLCFLSHIICAQEIKWHFPPCADSVTEENIDGYYFSFYTNGKKGYFNGEKIAVPAKYDEIIGSDLDNYYFIKNKNKWGIYNANSDSNKETLPCIYDSICKTDWPRTRCRIVKKNECAYYNLRLNKWETKFTNNCILPADEETQYTSYHKNVVIQNTWMTREEYLKKKNDTAIILIRLLFKNKEMWMIEQLNDNIYFVYAKFQYDSINYEYKNIIIKLSSKTIITEYVSKAQLDGKNIVCTGIKNKPWLTYTIDTITGKKITPFFELVDTDIANGYINYYWGEKSRTEYRLAKVINKKGVSMKGLFNKDYRIIIPFKFDDIYFPCSKDLLFCKIYYHPKVRTFNPYGYNINVEPEIHHQPTIRIFNLKTNKFIEHKFDTIQYVSNTAPMVVRKNKKYYIYNLETDRKTKLPFNKILSSLNEDSILIVSKKNKIQLYNLNQRCFISSAHDSIYHVSIEPTDERYKMDYGFIKRAIVFKDNLTIGVLNARGNIIIPPIYDNILAYGEPNTSYFPNSKGDFLFLKKGLYSYLYNLDSSRIEYDSLSQLKSIYKYSQNTDYWYKRNGKWGLVNKYLNKYLPAQYDTFYIYNDKYYLKQDGKYKIYNFTNSILQQEGYDTIIHLKQNDYLVIKSGKYGLLKLNKKPSIIPCIYDSIYYECDSRNYESNGNSYVYPIAILKKGNKFGISLHENYSTPAVFENYKYRNCSRMWAKYNGKWGILSKNQ